MKVGKIGETKDYATYRRIALSRINLLSKLEHLEGIEFSKQADGTSGKKEKFFIEVYWILKSIIGSVVESLIVLDRWLYLVENLKKGRIEVRPLFDQALSLRNLAIVVI